MFKFLSRFLDSNEKQISKLKSIVENINSFDDQMRGLKDSEFAKKTLEFKKRLDNDEAVDDLLPEAYALIREASR